ncbi:hypothetical protein [Vallitalea okinawensis]|uniref:hypothetical protein n=1 Tax=Vallitalea okinawensis TaxID=2078660 RepID=UPI000CFCEAFC|nr:hypothetical protein [Vallitalea okinawensis]
MKWFDRLFKKGEDGTRVELWYVVIILALGVIIFTFANKNITESEVDNIQPSIDTVNTSKTISYEERLESRLEDTISNIHGVGKVDILLTIESSKEIVLNKDVPSGESIMEEKDSSGGSRNSTDKTQSEETVLTNNPDGSSEPIVLKETMPIVQGVLILAENGDDPIVKETLTNAAVILLDIPAHKVQVVKMK